MKNTIKILIIFSFLFSQENKETEYSGGNFSIMKSMIFPGWGELDEYKKYNKEYILKRSRLFNFLEGAIICSYFLSDNLSESYEDDYKSYAFVNADVDWTDKNNAFAINVGKFNSTDAYNDDCNNPFTSCDEGQYDANNSSYWWEWNNEEQRLEYKDIRSESELLDDVATFMIAGLLINRIVSTFDVIAIKQQEENLFSFNIKKDSKNTGITFSYSF